MTELRPGDEVLVRRSIEMVTFPDPANYGQGWHPWLAAVKPWAIDNIVFDENAVPLALVRVLVAKRRHYECEDCWYSCPLSDEGCCDDSRKKECDCGAEQHNARIDALLAAAPWLADEQPAATGGE